jgi:ubiquinone/menaquinone biosynthesis C-methylase UbiE
VKQEKEATNRYQAVVNEIDNTAQLIRDRYFSAALGGLVAQGLPMPEISSVLDVGCGLGDWVVSMARSYPTLSIMGIDSSERNLREAQRRAHWSQTNRVAFRRMDVTKPLELKDNTFDLIHMFIPALLTRGVWSNTLAEMIRVLRPGGWLNLIDFEVGATSSPACNRLMELIVTTIRKVSNQPPTPLYLGIAVYLYKLLLDSSLVNVSYTTHVVDFGSGNRPGSSDFLEQMLNGMLGWKTLMAQVDIIKPDEYEAIWRTARAEMLQPHTVGYGYLVSTIGCKEG